MHTMLPEDFPFSQINKHVRIAVQYDSLNDNNCEVLQLERHSKYQVYNLLV